MDEVRQDVGGRADVIPIPLRADFTAHVHIPLDLTEAEARKMGRVLLAYSVDPAHPTLPEQLPEAGITIGEEG